MMRPVVTARFSLPDRYRLEGAVASGGMAAVYAAHDTLLDRPVAVKVLAEHLTADPDARRRFEREARAAASLSSHPAVVTIFDVGEHDGRSFMVMELRRGGTVGDVLRRDGSIEPRRALTWLRDIADALDTAHARGIVHRDVKPANLLLDEHDRVAVADFGIARLAWEDQLTATGQVLGTAAYISPEQAAGDEARPASDRYALAVVAFEMLTGSRPFEAEHFAAQARAHIEDEPPVASRRAPGLPAAVDAVLCRGLAKQPEKRWDTASELVAALERALDETAAAPQTETTRVMGLAGAGAAGAAGAGAAAGAPEAAAAGAAAAASGGGDRARLDSGGPSGTARRTRPPTVLPAARRDRGPARALALAALLVGVAIVAIVLASSGGGGGERAASPTAEPAREGSPAPEARSTAESQATPEGREQPAAGDPAALNAQGFELFERGDYAEAVPLLRQAVESCGDGGSLDPCGYALYNLGASLRRSGDAEAAIPVLEERLDRFGDNRSGDVQRELDAAYADAGLDQPGKDKDKGKGDGDD